MPKKDTSYVSGKGKSNPLAKETSPMKSPALPKKAGNMPNPMDGGPNKVASMPGTRFPKLTKPTALPPRPPRI